MANGSNTQIIYDFTHLFVSFSSLSISTFVYVRAVVHVSMLVAYDFHIDTHSPLFSNAGVYI